MEIIKISSKYKGFKDINSIDPNFIEAVLYQMKEFINGITIRRMVKQENQFDEEPLIALKALIEYHETELSMSIERATYDNTFLLNITINLDREDEEFFSSLYDFKVRIIGFLKRYVGEVYYIQDTSNEKICTELYKKIHATENDFRQVITDFYIRKLGCYDLSKGLADNAKEYSNWYNSRYINSPFRNIESPLFNLITDKLFDVLKRPIFDLNSEEKKRLNESVNNLDELLTNIFWTSEFTIDTKKLNEFKKNFHKDFDKYKKKTIYELYFKDALKDDFESMWKDFSKMRNMVAHNKPICKELYNDILDICIEIGKRLEEAKDKVDSMFIPEEVFMVDALYEQKQDELQAESDEIEYQREMAGIEPVWSEDSVIEMLSEEEEIVSLLSILNEYNDAKKLIEDYNEVYYIIDEKVAEFDIVQANKLKEKLEDEFNIKIEIDTNLDKDDALHDTKAEIMNSINEHILYLDNIYDEICDSKILDYFTMYESLADFKDLEGNEYSVYINGSLNPDHNHNEDIEIHLSKNNKDINKGMININYGGFDSYDYFENEAENPESAYISSRIYELNETVELVIKEIIETMNIKINLLKQVNSFILMVGWNVEV